MKTAIEYYFMCNYVGCVADKVNNLSTDRLLICRSIDY